MVVEFSYPRILLSLVMCQLLKGDREPERARERLSVTLTPTKPRQTDRQARRTGAGADGGGMAWPAPERRRVFKLVEVSEDIVGKTKIFAVSQNTAKKSH